MIRKLFMNNRLSMLLIFGIGSAMPSLALCQEASLQEKVGALKQKGADLDTLPLCHSCQQAVWRVGGTQITAAFVAGPLVYLRTS